MHSIDEDNFWREYLRIGNELDIRRFPYLYLDCQPCNRSLYNCVVGLLSGRLGMSKDIVAQKIIDLGLLNVDDNVMSYSDCVSMVKIGDVMRRIFS